MGLVEAILAGIQYRGLQKPVVFFSSLAGLFVFSALGAATIGVLISAIANTDTDQSTRLAGISFGLLVIALLFFGLAWLCGYFIKKCFD